MAIGLPEDDAQFEAGASQEDVLTLSQGWGVSRDVLNVDGGPWSGQSVDPGVLLDGKTTPVVLEETNGHRLVMAGGPEGVVLRWVRGEESVSESPLRSRNGEVIFPAAPEGVTRHVQARIARVNPLKTLGW